MSYQSIGEDRASQPNDHVPTALSDYNNGPAYQRREADLARVRENQRRSRARKREYVMDLENRLRQCELLGIEASAEVALGARRVAEENRRLRELLHAHGVDDRHIAHYIQNASGTWEVAPGTIPPMTGESAVQSLEQLLGPRRPPSMDPQGVHFTGALRSSRETSAPSPIGDTPPAWQPSPNTADSATYGSPTNATGSARSEENAVAFSYPTSYGISQPLISNTTSETTVPRSYRHEPPTPSRAFGDDTHNHFHHALLHVEDHIPLGYIAPTRTDGGVEPYRPSRNDP